jgi:hypothetical protein
MSKIEQSSGLLIRGFGVQVPGGAPALAWYFYRTFTLVGDHFRARFAPRLLVSLDLVVPGMLHGCPSRFSWAVTRRHP